MPDPRHRDASVFAILHSGVNYTGRCTKAVPRCPERAIGGGSSASVSYVDLGLDHHIARRSVSPSLKLLDHLGLIEIEQGPRCGNCFRFRTAGG